jgi:hypothetical protein
VVEALATYHLPLGALERIAEAGILPFGMHAHLMGTVLWVWAIREHFEARESIDKADHLISDECAHQNAAIVNDCDEQVCGNYIRLTAGPDDTLEFFDGGHFFG